MTLPVMSTPTYELTVPSTKQKIKYRPFLVKEEKALLIAQQSENQQTMLDTLKGVIKACTFDKLDVDKLAIFDFEYIFTQLRAKSVGEFSELIFNCMQCNDPKAKMHVNLDLTSLEVKFHAEHNAVIPLFEEVGIKMKYPDLSLMNKMKNETQEVDLIFDIVLECIDYVYDKDEVYPAAEQTKKELETFINNLTQDQFSKIQKFFETMPKLEKTIEFDCPVCKYHHQHVVQGLESFF